MGEFAKDMHGADWDKVFARQARRADLMPSWLDAIALRPGERVLDLAAGTGTSSEAFAAAGADVVPCDFSTGMVAVGKSRRPERAFVAGDAMRLPFADASFDAVVCTYSLCGFRDPRRGVEEMLRVLRPDGDLLLADHVGSSNPLLRVAQWALEAVTYPLHGERFTRRPLRIVEALGVRIAATERLHHGIIERVHARR